MATGTCPAAVRGPGVSVGAEWTADAVPHVFISRVAFASIRVTDPSAMAVAGHADAERPHVGCIPPVASSTPLAELPLVAIGALAPLHPRREDAGSGLCRHQGDVVNVAGAVLPEGGSDPEGCQVSQQPAVFKVVQPGAPLAAWVLIQPEGVGLADTTGQDLPRG